MTVPRFGFWMVDSGSGGGAQPGGRRSFGHPLSAFSLRAPQAAFRVLRSRAGNVAISATRVRRAMVLPIVLALLGLLAIVMAGFIFFIRAETAGTQAHIDMQQARLAAESGFEEVVATLRVGAHDVGAWFDKPQRFRHGLVWGEKFNRENDPIRETRSRKEIFEKNTQPDAAWRFSVVAPTLEENIRAMRYGVTPESGKLNLNSATPEQIERLFVAVLTPLGVENPHELVNAFLDWVDGDDDPRAGGAEGGHYNTLEPPYKPKNGPLDTLDELLLIKGYTAALLYGEDTNRNGILDPNEDDADETFPEYDNGDGVLNQGLAAYVTIWSREPDTALDNKPRIYLGAPAAEIQARMAQLFQANELSPETQAFILQVRGLNPQLRSPADLFPGGETPPEGALPDGEAAPPPDEGAPTLEGGAPPPVGEAPQPDGGDRSPAEGEQAGEQPEEEKQPRERSKLSARAQEKGEEEPGVTPGPQPTVQGPLRPPGQRAMRGGRLPGQTGSTPPPPGAAPPPVGPVPGGPAPGIGADTPLGQLIATSPVTPEEMSIIMDRFTARAPQQTQEGIVGLVNINTAPSLVLSLIPEITPEAVAGIIAMRRQLDPAALRTTAWPMVTGAVDPYTYKRIAPYITTKAYQVRVEVVGYADHSKVMRRMEWIVEMLGPLAQVRYHRDLTSLGLGWPIDDDDLERVASGR